MVLLLTFVLKFCLQKVFLYREKIYVETHHDPISQLMRSKSVKEDLGIVDPPSLPRQPSVRRESAHNVSIQVMSAVQETLKNFHPLRDAVSGGGTNTAGAAVGERSSARNSVSVKRDSVGGRSARESLHTIGRLDIGGGGGQRESVHVSPSGRESLRKLYVGGDRESVHERPEWVGLRKPGAGGGDRESFHGSDAKSMRSLAVSIRSMQCKSNGANTPNESLRRERIDDTAPDLPKATSKSAGPGEFPLALTVSGYNQQRSLGDLPPVPTPRRASRQLSIAGSSRAPSKDSLRASSNKVVE